jgi:hypothetical protein
MFAVMEEREVERLRIELEREKFEFEKEKFRADASRRAEELAKLKADRERSELDAADLRVPYNERASYRTAIYQGRASIVAVIALLASALSLYDTFEAKQDEALAKAAAQSAKDQKVQADREKQVAEKALESLGVKKNTVDAQIKAAQVRLRNLETEAAKARESALLGPVDALLSALGPHPKPEQYKLIEEMLKADSAAAQRRRAYLRTVAFSHSTPLMLRFYLLSNIYKTVRSLPGAEAMREQEQLKLEMLSLTDEPKRMLQDEYHEFWSSMDYFFGISQMHYYACRAYEQLDPSEPTGNVGTYSINEIAAQYILYTYSAFPECFKASVDALETRHIALLFLTSFWGAPRAFSQALFLNRMLKK